MARKIKTKKIVRSTHLLEVRAFYIALLLKKGFKKQEVAVIFNIHPSQITRALNAV